MVKLIRLLTSKTDGSFDVDFTSDINIPVGSKVALANLSLEGAETEIIVTDDNNKITVQYSDTVSTIAEIEKGTYSQSQLSALLENIQTNLNIAVSDDAVCIGQQFKVSQADSKKVQIEKKQAYLNEHTASWKLENVDKLTLINGNEWESSLATNTDQHTNAMMTDNEWCKGGGVLTCRIGKLIYDNTSPGGEFNGFTLGLCRVKPSTLLPINSTNIDFGIRCFGSGFNYGYYAGGELVENSGESVNYGGDNNYQNDILQISISDGSLKLMVYQYNQTPTILYEQQLAGFAGTPLADLKLYPFISFQGKKGNAKVFQVQYTADPFLTASFYQPNLTPALNTIKAPVQQVEHTAQSLTWGGLSLANFLGFLNLRYPSIGTILAKGITYTADSQFIIKNVSDSLVVELFNISLASYDSQSGQRRNFLAVIPAQSNLVEGKVIYEASNLVYLDIDTSTPSQLRNIRGRILKGDLSPVSTVGSIVLTLLIKSSSE